MILLMDGVRYEEWTPPDEAALASIVEEHAEDIFGKDSLYFGDLKTRIRSAAGAGSIPDGWAVLLGVPLQAYPVEIELAAHDVYGHISPQIDKILAALKNPATQQQIVAAIYHEMSKDGVLNARAKAKIGPNELHKLLSDAISGQPQQLLIVIDSASPQLRECAANKSVPPKVVEFTTFRRVGAETVHIYQLEPLVATPPPAPPPPLIPPPNPPGRRQRLQLRGGVGLDEVLEVCEQVYRYNREFGDALRIVANQNQRRVHESTVRDKCTRKLGLKTAQFRDLLADRSKLRAFLVQKFPDQRTVIEQRLGESSSP